MPIPVDVAALTKREHAYRTRLVGLMTLLLAFALIILPTFKSQIPGSSSDYRLLGFLDTCSRKPDDCPDDKNKENARFCGCGIPNTDTDGDRTPDCHDKCPYDAGKASPGACGCGTVDTYTDSDKDDILDCIDGCIENDPNIQAICDKDFPGDECGCIKQFISVRHECGEQCLSGILYCLNIIIEKSLHMTRTVKATITKLVLYQLSKVVMTAAIPPGSILMNVMLMIIANLPSLTM